MIVSLDHLTGFSADGNGSNHTAACEKYTHILLGCHLVSGEEVCDTEASVNGSSLAGAGPSEMRNLPSSLVGAQFCCQFVLSQSSQP